MLYFRGFELLRYFIIGFANTRTDFRTKIECFRIVTFFASLVSTWNNYFFRKLDKKFGRNWRSETQKKSNERLSLRVFRLGTNERDDHDW